MIKVFHASSLIYVVRTVRIFNRHWIADSSRVKILAVHITRFRRSVKGNAAFSGGYREAITPFN